MNGNPPSLRKWLLAALLPVLFLIASFAQQSLNRQRSALGLREFTELKGAPPILAFTTVALGGVRGLIANILWVRSIELQDEGKYFEKVQLTDWITKLQPHIAQVWTMQAWDMAYNISVKFTDPADRWRWVQRGIELLRDEGLKYNPKETLIYHWLAWIFQHKIGHDLDDAHMYYKRMWAREMTEVFGAKRPDFDELLNPQTDDARRRVALLRDKYKLDPQIMKTVDERYGPLEWRLPDAHAIYWAYLGLQRANPKEAMTLRRVVYQSMMQAFRRGRLISVVADGTTRLEPNLDIIPKLNDVFLELMAEDEEAKQQLPSPYRNWLLNAVEFLYTENRMAEAAQWYQLVREKFPDQLLFPEDPQSKPANLTLEEFVVRRVTEIAGETNREKTTMVISGLFLQSFINLALGEDDKSLVYDRLARRIWERYMTDIGKGQEVRVGLDPIGDLQQRALDRLLTPDGGMSPLLQGYLRTKLELPAPTNAPPSIPPSPSSTNAPVTPGGN